MGEILNFLPLFPAFSPSLFPAGPRRGAICFNSERVSPTPHGSARKEPACNAGAVHAGLILGWGRAPRGGSGHALQYSCLKNSMDRGAWRVTVQRVEKSQTRLSARRRACTHRHRHTHTRSENPGPRAGPQWRAPGKSGTPLEAQPPWRALLRSLEVVRVERSPAEWWRSDSRPDPSESPGPAAPWTEPGLWGLGRVAGQYPRG